MTTTALAAPARPTTPVRLNPDHPVVLGGLLVVLVAVAASSFTLSFTGVSAAAPWAAIPLELAWLVPVALEVAMLAYGVAAAIQTHRGESARLPWTLVWALTTVSSAINAAHAWDAGPRGWQGIAGAIIAAMFPFMTLAASHIVVRVVFAPRLVGAQTTAASAGQTDTDVVPVVLAIWDTRDTDTASPTALPPAVDVETLAAVPGTAPVVLVTERVPETHAAPATATPDAQTDTGHQRAGQTTRTTARGRVAAHREEIVRLALTTNMSGRAIAAERGLDRTAVCALVSETRTRRTGARPSDTDSVALAV